MRVGRPSLPLVDVAEQEQRLALDVGAAEARRRLGHLSKLVACLLELPEHHRNVCAAEAQLELHARRARREEVERPRVVAVRLAQALAPLGAAGCVRERRGGLRDRRLDRAARDLAGEPARLLEVPGDDLDELVGAAGRLVTQSEKRTWSCARRPFGTCP